MLSQKPCIFTVSKNISESSLEVVVEFKDQEYLKMMRAYIFFGILLLLTIYLGLKINLLMGGRRSLSVFITLAILISSIAWLFIYRGNNKILQTTWYPFLLWIGNICMGLVATFLLFSLVLDIVHLGVSLWDRSAGSSMSDTDIERRRALFKVSSQGLLMLSVAMAGLGYLTARYGLKIKKVQIPLPQLPSELTDLRIVQISDLHIGLTIDKDYVQRVVDQVMQQKPDMIMITGDMVDGTPENLQERWQPLRQINASSGVFFITGNHEYYSGAESWIALIKDLGFIPLINENKIVSYKNIPVLVAGVTDTSGGQFLPGHAPDTAKARGQDQQAALKILLAHRPEAYLEAEALGFDLQLSGHTHAGQFFPFNMLVMFAHKFYKGLNQYGKLWVYVNQGTGYWGPANRFALPPEITLINFVRKDEPA